MEIEHDLQSFLTEKLGAIKAAAEKTESSFDEIWTYLSESEQLLIRLMTSHQDPPTAPGSIEYSPILYTLNHKLSSDWVETLHILGMPTSNITVNDWGKWETKLSGEGVLSGDGSLINMGKFAILDIGWLIALFKFYEVKLGIVKKHTFNTNPAKKVITGQDSLKVAIFGDWGTGNYPDGNLPKSPSQLVMDQIAIQAPDISIHLGDVYYAGTSDEETDRLLNSWYEASLGNFTMNSNHEMYDGANGLIDTTLANPIFADQNQTTYFSIEFGNWVIVGLDSAYNSPVSSMFMDGAIGQTQIDYLKGLNLDGKQLVLLTHHNPIPETGITDHQPPLVLWDQVLNTAGVTPAYWFWGHIHNGIVYADTPSMLGVKGRCLGNAAIPQGNASWFENNDNIDFYCNTPLPDPTTDQALRVTNGFGILEFTENDLTETWYDQNGTQLWTL